MCATLNARRGAARIFSTEMELKKGRTAVIVGAQWGDEGKGKIVDVLSEEFSVVARYAGGHNAGHTVIIHGKKFILQLVPSGVLRDGCLSVIGNGVVLDPIAFLKETAGLRAAGVKIDGNLFVSNRAQVILPYHRMMELGAENAPGRVKIGTTSRGIGPAYEDKIARRGLRVSDLLDLKLLKTHIENACREKNMIAHALFNSDPLDADKMFKEYSDAAQQIAPFVCDTALLLNKALADGKSIVFEGAQGTMLDIDHGTYPFVTSSSATSGGAVIGTGVAPTAIDMVIGITKAYCTRVGGGPFPTEAHDESGEDLRKRGNEFGAVTGRPRRTGWLDLPLLRYAGMINGISWLCSTTSPKFLFVWATRSTAKRRKKFLRKPADTTPSSASTRRCRDGRHPRKMRAKCRTCRSRRGSTWLSLKKKPTPAWVWFRPALTAIRPSWWMNSRAS
jgi:adenylosuccinate synthase